MLASIKFVDNLRVRDSIILAAALVGLLVTLLRAPAGFPLDDSWIHQVYARNLGQAGEWAFVPGVPSAGSTSPLYTILLSVGYRLNLPYELWTHLLGFAALGATGLLAARMAALLAPHRPMVALAAGLAVVLAWHLLWAAASGMETMLSAMWTLALPWLALRERERPATSNRGALLRGGLFGLFAGLAIATRPEGALLPLLAGAALLFSLSGRDWRLFTWWAVGAGLAGLLTAAPYFALNLTLTGGLFPDTAAAKQAALAPALAESLPVRIGRMLLPLAAGPQLFLLPGVIWFAAHCLTAVRRERQRLVWLVPLAWSIALIVLYAWRLPADYQHGRYVIPALPTFLVLAVVGTAWMLDAARGRLMGRVLTRSVALACALAFPIFALAIGPTVYAQDVAIINEEMVTAARWIDENLPPDELLAIHDIGAVGYFTPRPILDIAGLVTPEAIPLIGNPEGQWQLMEARGARYLLAFPNQIPGQNTKDPRLCLLFDTQGPTTQLAGEANMAIYALAWDGVCAEN